MTSYFHGIHEPENPKDQTIFDQAKRLDRLSSRVYDLEESLSQAKALMERASDWVMSSSGDAVDLVGDLRDFIEREH